MCIFAISLSGLFPLLVMYSKTIASLENRQPVKGDWYLTPSENIWQRKLGAGAYVASTPPAPKSVSLPVLDYDDGDDGYAETTPTEWTTVTDATAFEGDYRLRAAPEEPPPEPTAEVARWTFNNVEDGWYRIEVTWTPVADLTDAAKYAVFDGATRLDPDPAAVNQQNAPAGDTDSAGRFWQILKTRYVRDGSVDVVLFGQVAGKLAADGARIVPIENDVSVNTMHRSLDSEEINVNVSITQNVP